MARTKEGDLYVGNFKRMYVIDKHFEKCKNPEDITKDQCRGHVIKESFFN